MFCLHFFFFFIKKFFHVLVTLNFIQLKWYFLNAEENFCNSSPVHFMFCHIFIHSVMITHIRKRGELFDWRPTLAQQVKNNSGILIGCHHVSLSPGAFVALGLHWLGSCLGRNPAAAWVGPHSGSSSAAVLGSDDWHSANSHQHRPNNSGRALMNVFGMYDLHNIWKPRSRDLPQCLYLTRYSQYFPLLCCSWSCFRRYYNIIIFLFFYFFYKHWW